MAARDETDGERIVQECASECDPYDAVTWGHKIARRIDAALADQANRINAVHAEHYGKHHDAYAKLESDARAALAERDEHLTFHASPFGCNPENCAWVARRVNAPR